MARVKKCFTTCDTMYYTNGTNADHTSKSGFDIDLIGKDMAKKGSKKEFGSELGEKLLSKFLKEIRRSPNSGMVLFTRPKSAIALDLSTTGYMFNLAYPILADNNGHSPSNVNLHRFSLAIISDVLEYLPTVMSKANVIREALATLDSSRSACLLIAVKHGQTDIFMGEREYLESLVLFAGAKEIIHPACFKNTRLIYVVAKRKG